MKPLKTALLVLFAFLCVTGFAQSKYQEKVFQAAIKKGRPAREFYSADFSKMATDRKSLVDFANWKGYLLRNIQEGMVAQFGTYMKAVKSVEFLPITEMSAYQAEIYGSAATSVSTTDLSEKTTSLVKKMVTVLNSDPDQPRYVVELDANDHYVIPMVSQAARLCDCYLCGVSVSPFFEEDYVYIANLISSQEAEKMILDRIFHSNLTAFPREGSARIHRQSDEKLGYYAGSSFPFKEHVKWTGEVVDGTLNGTGSAFYEEDGIATCIQGTFDKGKPIGEFQCSRFSLLNFTQGKKEETAIVRIYPFENHMARYEASGVYHWYDVTGYLNDSFEPIVPDLMKFSFNDSRNDGAVRVEGFQDEFLVLATWDPFFRREIRLLVDREGTTRIDDPVIADLFDRMAYIYDHSLVKAFTRKDILAPGPVLSKNGYLPNEMDELIRQKQHVTKNPLYAESVVAYKTKYPFEFVKTELAEDLARLYQGVEWLNIDKVKEEKQAMNVVNSMSTDKVSYLIFGYRWPQPKDAGVTADRYERRKAFVINHLNNLRNNPSFTLPDQEVIRQILTKAFDERIAWWETVYGKAEAALGKRIAPRANAERETIKQKIEERRQFMCDNCKINGKESTIPRGYQEAFSFLFFDISPAQSEEDGEIVLMNGDKIAWRFLYGEGNDRVQANSPAYDIIDQNFKSVEEMLNTILEQCQKRWGK